jgi:hypothetical protein
MVRLGHTNPQVGGLLFCLTDHILGLGKMSQSGNFVTIQVKLSQLHYVHPWDWVNVKSLDGSSGDEMSQ